MKAKISKDLVRGLDKASKTYEVFDGDLPGFLLRVEPSGKMTYYVAYSVKGTGQRRRYRIGTVDRISPAAARGEAMAVLGRVAKGGDPVGENRQAAAGLKRDRVRRITLGAFLKDPYGPWLETHRRSGAAMLAVIEREFADLLKKPMCEISPFAIEKWRRGRLAGENPAKPATVNRALSYLKSALARAVEWNLLDVHPLLGNKVAKIPGEAKRVRFLTIEEKGKLFAALAGREETMRVDRDSYNAWARIRRYPERQDLRTVPYADFLRPLVEVALLTGLRRRELFTLLWSDIDFERAVLHVRAENAKSGKPRDVDLCVDVAQTLKKWRSQNTSPYVFPNPQTNKPLTSIATSWKHIIKASGLTNFTFHDLRHCFGSDLVQSGVSLYTVQKLMGHSSIAMTERYSHLTRNETAAAVGVLRLTPLDNVIPFESNAEGGA